MRVSLIIAAGGAGERFQKGLKRKDEAGSKLLFPIGSRPLLRHTLEAFQGIPQIQEIVLAVPPQTQSWMRRHLLKGFSGPVVRLVPGGRTRAESVYKALRRTSPGHEWVLVHDGARPFPPQEAIKSLFIKRPNVDALILGCPVVPTLKEVWGRNGHVVRTLDRSRLMEAQTPQLVRRKLLLQAYRENRQAFRETDEASLIESVGGKVRIKTHEGWNIKVTTRQDLELARAYHERRTLDRMAIGFGRDTHRLVENRKLYLGGVLIPSRKGALGHSDGDVLLHAAIDGILGALGAGDIGEWFSDRNPRLRGIRSERMLKQVLQETLRRRWAPVRLDTVIVLETPRLGPHKEKIRENLARMLKMDAGTISVKAKTMEGLGPEGEGKAVSAEALVTLHRTDE